ncbi:DUF5694 domain-containing protein [Lacihabitans soyangensis]|uniref:TraB/GumN family protein n=1 Tax=Lacihabitans soyangensis TaxID=869394 RepID=A0AAE3H770_9BACT|nr:DUF5694 domain-containing protein [Lacihabitans soyangensis]MCP9765410.1 hypothetical protein [Lacihabitans soyangensis]
MRKLITFLLLLNSTLLFAQKEVLLIGTFHFNNPGFDVVKTNPFDVTTANSQKELENISNKIKGFGPEKIFVEWEFDAQASLDTLYDLYLKNEYFEYVARKYPNRSFYTQNEIIQLAFRTAKKLGHKKVYAIDYPYAGDFPYDSLMTEIEKAKQMDLKAEIDKQLVENTQKSNRDRENLQLTELILEMNTDEFRKQDLGFYISLFNRGGRNENFVGAYLNSEWYKRNLYMYALLQKLMADSKKGMVLLGASHVGMFSEFIQHDNQLKAIQLKTILNKK